MAEPNPLPAVAAVPATTGAEILLELRRLLGLPPDVSELAVLAAALVQLQPKPAHKGGRPRRQVPIKPAPPPPDWRPCRGCGRTRVAPGVLLCEPCQEAWDERQRQRQRRGPENLVPSPKEQA